MSNTASIIIPLAPASASDGHAAHVAARIPRGSRILCQQIARQVENAGSRCNTPAAVLRLLLRLIGDADSASRQAGYVTIDVQLADANPAAFFPERIDVNLSPAERALLDRFHRAATGSEAPTMAEACRCLLDKVATVAMAGNSSSRPNTRKCAVFHKSGAA